MEKAALGCKRAKKNLICLDDEEAEVLRDYFDNDPVAYREDLLEDIQEGSELAQIKLDRFDARQKKAQEEEVSGSQDEESDSEGGSDEFCIEDPD